MDKITNDTELKEAQDKIEKLNENPGQEDMEEIERLENAVEVYQRNKKPDPPPGSN